VKILIRFAVYSGAIISLACSCADKDVTWIDVRDAGTAGFGGGAGTAGVGGSGGDAGSWGGAGPDGGASGFGGGCDGGCAELPLCPTDAGISCRVTGEYCRAGRDVLCVCAGHEWFCSGGDVPATVESALRGSYRGEDNVACWECAQAQCSSHQVACSEECLRPLACELESGCALAPSGALGCYCGTQAAAGGCLYTSEEDGACRAELATGINYTTPPGILSHFFDPSSGTGAANALMRCLADSHCTSCFRTHDRNACPSVTAFLVAPSHSAVGRSIALSAHAEDLDGPEPLRYEWTVNQASLGKIDDPQAANTIFTCQTPGNATVTLTIGDGDTGCSWSETRIINCDRVPCLSAAPLDISARAALIGETIAVTADVVDATGQPGAFEYRWTVEPNEVGGLEQDNLPQASYTCGTPGVVEVTLEVRDPARGCSSIPQSIELVCVSPGSGAPRPASTLDALTGAYRGQDNAACAACAESAGCIEVASVLPCEYRRDAAERALCLQLLACELETGCASGPGNQPSYTGCYCSYNDLCFDPRGAHDGPCSTELQAALLSDSPDSIRNRMNDTTFPGGQANNLVQCLTFNGCNSCFPPPNACPLISIASATPPSAAVGESIALTAQASDPDQSSAQLYYLWLPSSTDAGELGTVTNAFTADATFTCERAGTTDVVLLVSDGACPSTAYVTVTCTAP
jgi:hypothetical protein